MRPVPRPVMIPMEMIVIVGSVDVADLVGGRPGLTNMDLLRRKGCCGGAEQQIHHQQAACQDVLHDPLLRCRRPITRPLLAIEFGIVVG